MRPLAGRPIRRDAGLFDVVGLGEISVDDVLLVDAVPLGGKARVRRRERLGGGQVATAMVAARRLGLRAALMGVVGTDAAGAEAIEELAREGVDTRAVRRRESASPTHHAVIVVDAAGDRTVLWGEAPGGALGADEVDEALARAARVVHVDGNALDAAIRAARAGREAGALISCDLDRWEPPATDELLALADVCIVSQPFLAAFGGAGSPDEAARSLPALAAKLPVGAIAGVTLGAAGACALAGDELVAEPARRPPCPIIDTTACGDTFRAAFLAALLDGADLRTGLRRGNAAAALKAMDLGRRGCPTRDALDRFLDRGSPS